MIVIIEFNKKNEVIIQAFLEADIAHKSQRHIALSGNLLFLISNKHDKKKIS